MRRVHRPDHLKVHADRLRGYARSAGLEVGPAEAVLWLHEGGDDRSLRGAVADRLKSLGYEYSEEEAVPPDDGMMTLFAAVHSGKKRAVTGYWLSFEHEGRRVALMAWGLIATPSKPVAKADPKHLDGIYVGLTEKLQSLWTYGTPVRVDFMTFLPDGRAFWHLPGAGLDGWDPDDHREGMGDYWGSYQVSPDGKHVSVRYGSGAKGTASRDGGTLTFRKPAGGYDGKELVGIRESSLTLAPPLDGLRLEGRYRRDVGSARRSDGVTHPSITFRKDGTFEEEGVCDAMGGLPRYDGSPDERDGRGGAGTYRIRRNTLHLNYSDGREKRVSLLVLPDAKGAVPSSPPGLWIWGNPFTKR